MASALSELCDAYADPESGERGRSPGHRCLQWCESDGVLVVSLSSSLPANQMATFTFDVLNSAVKQAQKHTSVTVWAPGVSVDIIVNQIPIAGILVAEAIPEFTFFQLDHLECACPSESNDMYDTSASMWRGGCPGMINTVILKFGTNVPMHSNTQITLSGLVSLYGQNLETPSVRDALQGVSVVKWDPVSDEIILPVAPGTVKGGAHNAISLDVKMPNEKMPTQAGGVVATIRASAAGVGADLCLKDKVSETPLATATAILANCPRSFILRSIGKSACEPLACNDITVTMAVSKLLSEETDLAIIMLMGFHPVMQLSANCQVSSASPSCGAVNSNDLVLSDGEVGSNHRNLFHDLKGVVGHAHWNASTMSVHVHLARDAKLEPFQPYVISFSLKNGPQPSSGKIRITALDGDGLCAGVKTAGKCLGQEMVSTPAHFGACVPQFTIASIAQQHQLPGCNGKLNNITVSLKTNVELTSPFNFTIGGLHVSNVKYLSGFESDADVSIIESASVFTIFVSRQNFSAEILYDIVVSVVNTGDPVAFPRQQMTVSATAFGNSFSEILQQSTDMNVDPVGLVATIRQRTPYPSALNTLTFELTTNVALPVGAQITISGLMKTSSFGSSINLFNSSYSSGSESAMTCSTVLSRGAWNAVTGRLVINVTSRIEVLAPLSCSFHVINPSTTNEPPIVRFSISCDGPCVNEGNNCFPLGLTIATSGSTGSPFQGCFKCLEPCVGCGQPCDAADSEVLRVHAPGIILKHVRATNDSPMANNTIRLDLAQVLQDDDSVELQIHHNRAAHQYKLLFDTTNPDCSRNPSVLVLASSDPSKCNMHLQKCVLDTNDNDVKVFEVADPGFKSASIVQSTTVPSATNTLKVTLSFNLPRFKGSKVTLSGIINSATGDHAAIPIHQVCPMQPCPLKATVTQSIMEDVIGPSHCQNVHLDKIQDWSAQCAAEG